MAMPTLAAAGLKATTARRPMGIGTPLALGALLLAQLALALVLGMRGTALSPIPGQGALLGFSREDVTRVRISGPEGAEVELVRSEQGWRIPALGDFPAAAYKVDGLLEKIAGAQRRLPVATSPEAQRRFRVADDAFERRIVLAAEGRELGVLYLGDSPGFRRLFVRAGGEPAVHEAEIGLFDAPASPSDWADHTALHLAEEDIRRIELPEVVVERAEQGWALVDPKPGEELDQAAASKAARQLANLSFVAVLGNQDVPEDRLANPGLSFRITLASGEVIEYRLSGTEPPIVLALSNRPQRFELADYLAQDLAALTRASFLVRAPSEDPGSPAAPEPAEPPTAPPAAE